MKKQIKNWLEKSIFKKEIIWGTNDFRDTLVIELIEKFVKQKIYYIKFNTYHQLKEESEELINGGNSKEKAEGYGMQKVLNSMNKPKNNK
jgi:hypothetical protein